MKEIINKIKSIPKGVKICEILYIVTIAIYMFMLSGGGLFTTFYSLMLVICTAAFTSIYFLFFKRNYIAAIINIVSAAILFFHFMAVA